MSYTEGESEESLAALGPRRLSEVDGQPLKERDMAGKGEEQVAGVKVQTGEGKAPMARKYSGSSVNEQKLRRSSVLVTRWRPEVEGLLSEERGEVMGPRWE